MPKFPCFGKHVWLGNLPERSISAALLGVFCAADSGFRCGRRMRSGQKDTLMIVDTGSYSTMPALFNHRLHKQPET